MAGRKVADYARLSIQKAVAEMLWTEPMLGPVPQEVTGDMQMQPEAYRLAPGERFGVVDAIEAETMAKENPDSYRSDVLPSETQKDRIAALIARTVPGSGKKAYVPKAGKVFTPKGK